MVSKASESKTGPLPVRIVRCEVMPPLVKIIVESDEINTCMLHVGPVCGSIVAYSQGFNAVLYCQAFESRVAENG